jgi:hypothetical protein
VGSFSLPPVTDSSLPRATLLAASGTREWRSTLVPRYQRRLREVNESVVATYRPGGQYPMAPRGARAAPQGGAPVEECRLADRGHAQGGA